MSKYRLDNPANTSLDPFAFEKQFAQPNLNNPSPFSGVAGSLEVVAPDRVDDGYGTMGNSGYALQAINEAKAANQGNFELLAKGLGNVVKTIGIEIGKTPGYLGGVVGAIGNEVLGDGKQSMSMIVDNGWVNAFENLDQATKEMMPVYISQQVSEGNLMDKMGSGAWWASTGADGLGFMLSMFAPGAVAKALKVGSGIARVGEGLANVAPKLGKWATGKGLLESVGDSFAYTQKFARNADGYASTVLNTTIESSAEAANTFDNLKSKYIAEGLSEDQASQKAGEGAAAVFKGNMALLAVSNYLDEMWIWKTIGSAGSKEAAQSVLNKVIKDGVIDTEALKQVSKEFTRGSVLKKVGQNIGKNILKEGFYEEGSQTTLQQNIEEEGSKGFLGNLVNIGASYFDDFANNTELHESIFLGGLLGGGASIIGTVQENNALKAALTGSKGRTADNFWVKYGILPQTNSQKGLINLVNENHIKQFRSYKDFLDSDGKGSFTLNEQKLADAQLEQVDNLRTNILYDIAVAEGDKLGQEIYGQYLAANYAQSFLGQEGGLEIFNQHVQDQVLPAWRKRFEDSFGRPATSKEESDYTASFKQSGERVFKAHNTASETNYPERYYKENNPDYADFRNEYFHNKFETLVTLDALKERRSQVNKDLMDAGVTILDLEDLNTIKDPVKKQLAQQIKNELDQIDKYEELLNIQYPKFFSKAGVKEMYEEFKARKNRFEELSKEAAQENQELKQEVDFLPTANQAEIDRLINESNSDNTSIPLKGSNGKNYSLVKDETTGENKVFDENGEEVTTRLSDLKLSVNDVSKEDFDSFKETSEASDEVLQRIAEKLINGEPLSDNEKLIAQTEKAKLQDLFNKEKAKIAERLAKQESVSNTVEDEVDNDESISQVSERKGVNLYPSTGRNLQDTLVEIKPGIFVEKMTDKPSQKLWFETLDQIKNPQDYTVQVVKKDDRSNMDLFNQIDRDANENSKADDLYVVLYKDGKPVTKDGNYIFTGLWRPNTLYPVKDGKPRDFMLAEKSILDNFLFDIRLPKLKLGKLTKNDKEVLTQNGVTDFSEQGIMTAAFFHAKKEYQEWYQSLQENPGQLQVAGITKGHAVKGYTSKDKSSKYWGSPFNIPGLKLRPNPKLNSADLVGGKFEMSIDGTIKVGDETYTISQGDVVIVDDQNNVHPMKARNINEDEVKTILYLLSLRTGNQPTETFKIKPPNGIRFGNTVVKDVPIFFNESTKRRQTRSNLIETLISFGSKNGGKGEIYFNQQSVNDGSPMLVWTDFEGNTKNISVSLIENAIQNNDFSQIDDLVLFLQQKKFNVNEHLLSNPTFVKPQLVYKRDQNGKQVPELEWNEDQFYYEVLLGDVLTTTTLDLPGYPSRVQRNMWFNKEPLSQDIKIDEVSNTTGLENLGSVNSGKAIMKADVESKGEFKIDLTGASKEQSDKAWKDANELVNEEDYELVLIGSTNILTLSKKSKVSAKEKLAEKIRNRKNSLDSFKEDMDKILTTSDLLKMKIQNGEIIQKCK